MKLKYFIIIFVLLLLPGAVAAESGLRSGFISDELIAYELDVLPEGTSGLIPVLITLSEGQTVIKDSVVLYDTNGIPKQPYDLIFHDNGMGFMMLIESGFQGGLLKFKANSVSADQPIVCSADSKVLFASQTQFVQMGEQINKEEETSIPLSTPTNVAATTESKQYFPFWLYITILWVVIVIWFIANIPSIRLLGFGHLSAAVGRLKGFFKRSKFTR